MVNPKGAAVTGRKHIPTAWLRQSHRHRRYENLTCGRVGIGEDRNPEPRQENEVNGADAERFLAKRTAARPLPEHPFGTQSAKRSAQHTSDKVGSEFR